MREAEITCLTRMVRIPDLGLEMTKGDMERITEEAAEGSADLALMRRLNAVQVRWVRRYNTQRGIPIKTPGKRRSDNQPRPNVRPVRTPPSPETDDQRTVSARGRQFTPPEVDLEVLADKLAARFGGEIDRVIRAVRETRPVAYPNGGTQSSTAPAGTVDDEMPVFLPENLVDHDAKATIHTTKTTGAGKGIDDAAAALKKARSGRKRKEK